MEMLFLMQLTEQNGGYYGNRFKELETNVDVLLYQSYSD
ncbi:Protein of unknown function [Bacillus mycoides]|nr:Protein of unknown function [Bacillus mycoides]